MNAAEGAAPFNEAVLAQAPVLRALIGNIALIDDVVEVDKQRLDLTRSEFKVLEYLLLAGDHAVVTNRQLRKHLYGDPLRRPSNVEQQFILRIRKRLSAAGASVQIRTVRNRGYMWEALLR